MHERRGVDLVRRFFLLLVSIALGSSCFLPPDPPILEDERERREMIRGAWDPPADTAEVGDPPKRREMIRGAWDTPAGTAEETNGDRAGEVRVIAPIEWDAGEVVIAGHWSAQVLPEGSEAMPEVSLSLFDSAAEGDVVGTATYDFPGYACHYALVLENAVGPVVELSQRWGVGPCAEAGRIVLEWDADDDLLGDWRHPNGRRWFQVRLTPTAPADAQIESQGMSRPGPGWLPSPKGDRN
jgi:hypothetical protein